MLTNRKGTLIEIDLQRFQNNKPALIACAILYAQPCGLNSEEVRISFEQLTYEESVNMFRNYFTDKIKIIN